MNECLQKSPPGIVSEPDLHCLPASLRHPALSLGSVTFFKVPWLEPFICSLAPFSQILSSGRVAAHGKRRLGFVDHEASRRNGHMVQ